MECHECQATQQVSPASAICSHCGAAVCADHTVAISESLTCTRPIAQQITVTPPARRLLCPVCALARQAFSTCCPQAVPAGR
ncbi:DUF2180 family protein [Kribbella sp. DT2]|uniref:DUF2180 family protein n=1 Tax=Kribbella sp. DT2 TaxID=3393427 RepID=UPI003CF4B669